MVAVVAGILVQDGFADGRGVVLSVAHVGVAAVAVVAGVELAGLAGFEAGACLGVAVRPHYAADGDVVDAVVACVHQKLAYGLLRGRIRALADVRVANDAVPVDEVLGGPCAVAIRPPRLKIVVLHNPVIQAVVVRSSLYVLLDLLELKLRRVHAHDDESGCPRTWECHSVMYGRVRMQLTQVYVQKSMSTTLPRRSSRLNGSVLIQPVMPTSCGAVGPCATTRGVGVGD